MTTYAHAHPLPDGRTFEHVHALPGGPAQAERQAIHATHRLSIAHPELARLEQSPAPGSPAWLREQAAEWRRHIEQLQAELEHAERKAAELEAQAERDEQEPPTADERIRRLFEGGV